MELLPGVFADNSALYFEETGVLVVSDLHYGYEAERRAAGLLLPRRHDALLRAELARLVKEWKPRRVILNGDVKHEFGKINDEEWRGVRRLLDWLKKKGVTVDVVLGNHDKLLKPILETESVSYADHALIKNGDARVLVVHGDKKLEELGLDDESLHARLVVMGHEHPALQLTDGVRTESVKCYLVGKESWTGHESPARREYTLVVMPSFNPLTRGSDVLRERPLGPLLTDTSEFSAFAIVDGKVLAFGPIEKVQRQQNVSVS